MYKIIFWISFFLFFSACSPLPVEENVRITEESPLPVGQTPSLGEGPAPLQSATPLEPISLPISIYILDDAEGDFSSARTETEIGEIYALVNEIWSQAAIMFEIRTISRVQTPHTVLDAIIRMDFPAFYQAANSSLEINSPSIINAFYTKDIGGPNGIAPFGARLFFVMDTPSVHDERVSAHEIGHILGLHHTLADTGRLLFPGTNGIDLTEEEIAVARYNARVLLEGQ